MIKNCFFACICTLAVFFFFSCIITPQPKGTSPGFDEPENVAPEFSPPEYSSSDLSPLAVSPVTSVPAIFPPETIPQEVPPELISQENPPETIPWVSPSERIPWVNLPEPIPRMSPQETISPVDSSETVPQEVPPELISQENPPETIPPVDPPETIPQEVPPEVVTLAAAAIGRPITEPEMSVIPPIGQDRVPVPELIMGRGIVLPKEMAAFLLESNPGVETAFIEELAYIYTEESAIEGVNSDVAFAQMCLETGFLRYGGLVTPDMNNFCGLGAIGPVERGLSFPNPRTGVRAHIQHLKAYASEEPLKQLLIDPRFHYVRRGSSPAITGLAGTWAADPAYAEKIHRILERLYSFYYKL